VADKERAEAGEWCASGSRSFGCGKIGVPLEPEATARLPGLPVRPQPALRRQRVESAGHHHGAGVKWTNLHLRRVSQNPRIAGLRVHQGKVIGPGNWEPILDADTLHGIIAFLNDPSRKNALAFERRHLLPGIAKCGICGSALYTQPPYSSCAGGGPARRGRSPKAPLWRGGVGGSTSRPSEVFLLLLLDDVGGFKPGLRRRLPVLGQLAGLLAVEKRRNGFAHRVATSQATSAFGGLAGLEKSAPSRSAAA
jgi:hypothetical protein